MCTGEIKGEEAGVWGGGGRGSEGLLTLSLVVTLLTFTLRKHFQDKDHLVTQLSCLLNKPLLLLFSLPL